MTPIAKPFHSVLHTPVFIRRYADDLPRFRILVPYPFVGMPCVGSWSPSARQRTEVRIPSPFTRPAKPAIGDYGPGGADPQGRVPRRTVEVRLWSTTTGASDAEATGTSIVVANRLLESMPPCASHWLPPFPATG